MTSLSLQQATELALQYHKAGRLREAESLYRQIIAEQPGHAQAIHGVGLVALQSGDKEAAVEMIRRAIALQPHFPVAHNNLGVALKELGQIDRAIETYGTAIEQNPNYAEANNNLGNALREKGRLHEAIAAYRRAIALKPNYAEAYNNMSVSLAEKGDFDAAVAACRTALALQPAYAEAQYNLGFALQGKSQFNDAIAAYLAAIALKPDYVKAFNNLGTAYKATDQLDKAVAAYRQAIALRPNFSETYSNLGNALKDNGRLDDAIAAYRQAISLDRNSANGHFNLALALLSQGDFQAGFEEHEWRWDCKEIAPYKRNVPQPLWDGRPLEGRTLLLHAEQGLGDTLQFIRYIPQAAQRGGRVVFECEPELRRLLELQADKCEIISQGQPPPRFDFHCPLLSLAKVFGTTMASIPAMASPLRADAADVRKWHGRLAELSGVAKVGLVWAGSPTHKNDRNRSLPLAKLAPLARVAGVRFFSLQKGPASEQAKAPPPGMELVDWTQDLNDFADTAALIANLDLVIAVDTSVAHLAGAMGKPVWTLLPFVADWRWLLDREDSPWYPSMRLFRQRSRGEWDSVIAKVAELLAAWAPVLPLPDASGEGFHSSAHQ